MKTRFTPEYNANLPLSVPVVTLAMIDPVSRYLADYEAHMNAMVGWCKIGAGALGLRSWASAEAALANATGYASK